MAPQKGKTATKGKKQILEENRHTLSFYRNMIIATNALFLLCNVFVFTEFTTFGKVAGTLAALTHLGSYQFLAYMARSRHSDDGLLLDGGLDLNMEAGIAEHVKDIIIVTGVCEVLGIISRYFWLLAAFVPFRAFHLLWKNLLGPYFFAPAPEEPEDDDRKQRKLARKMRYAAPSR